MNLRKVSITGFRSIRDKQELFVDELVTVMIGANDHGKSNLLAAVRALNDDVPLTDADRHWDLTDTDLPSIEWEFELSEEEREQVAKARPAVPPPPAPEPDQPVEQAKPQPTPEVPKRISFFREGAGAALVVLDEDDVFSQEQATLLLKLRPRVELFVTPQAIADEIQAAQLEQAQFESMKGIFLKADLWEKRAKLFVQDQWSSRQLTEASRKLTEVLRREWEQGKDLEWKFEHAGTNGNLIRLLIKDPAVRNNYVRPSQRSSGFTSFFILSLTVFARTSASPEKSFIFLFDEPGTYLHPIAQVNLQRVFESLAQRSQIIYATHSIFLVNKNVPTRNRVVRKDEAGTVIDRKPFCGNWKAVRDSLGITLAHNFLISDRTLLVEGPSDEIYVAASLLYLIRSGAADLDLNDFSIADAGSCQNMLAMARIMLDEGRKVVVMVDGDKHGQRVEKELKKTSPREIESGELAIMRLPDGTSIEDMVPRREKLFDGAVAAADALVHDGVRSLAEGKTVAQLKPELENADRERQGTTLGTMLEAVSKDWFLKKEGRREPLGKLLIAIRYEDELRTLVADEGHEVSTELADAVRKMTELLKLQPRKAEQLIFESK